MLLRFILSILCTLIVVVVLAQQKPDRIWVNGYLRADGTYVKGHYVNASPEEDTGENPDDTFHTFPVYASKPSYIVKYSTPLRSKMSLKSGKVLDLPKGARVKVVDSSLGGWWQIFYKDRLGFVQNSYLKYDNTNDLLSDLKYSDNPIKYLYKSNPDYTFQNTVNLREHRALSSAIKAKIPPETRVKFIRSYRDGWWEVFYEGKTGYISFAELDPGVIQANEKVELDREKKTGSNSSANNQYTISSRTSLRAKPNSQSTVIQRLGVGTPIQILNKANKYWWQVKYQGKQGWVKSALINKPG